MLPTSSTSTPTFTFVAMERMTLLFPTFLNPDSSAVTVYVPGGSCGKTKVPCGSDCVVWVTPRSASTTVTVAPGRAPPLESFTVPTRDDNVLWARTIDASDSAISVPIPALMACLTVLSLPFANARDDGGMQTRCESVRAAADAAQSESSGAASVLRSGTVGRDRNCRSGRALGVSVAVTKGPVRWDRQFCSAKRRRRWPALSPRAPEATRCGPGSRTPARSE
jgi:hypothetical protein